MLYIIIVNYENWEDTLDCLSSLFLDTPQNPYKVIVVDNSIDNKSTYEIEKWTQDPSSYPPPKFLETSPTKPVSRSISLQTLLEKECNYSASVLDNNSELTLIRSTNKGFASACNLGIQWAQKNPKMLGVWLLNNDTLVPPGTMDKLIEFTQKQPHQIGAIGTGLAHIPQEKETISIQALGGYFHPFHARPQHLTSPSQIHKLTYIVGASLLIRKHCLKEVGFIPEDYFLYYEDAAYCENIKRKNFKLRVHTNLFVYHKDGSSSTSKVKEYFYTRNLLFFSLKYYPYLFLLTLQFVLFTRFFSRLFKAEVSSITTLKGIGHFFIGVRGKGILKD